MAEKQPLRDKIIEKMRLKIHDELFFKLRFSNPPLQYVFQVREIDLRITSSEEPWIGYEVNVA